MKPREVERGAQKEGDCRCRCGVVVAAAVVTGTQLGSSSSTKNQEVSS